jgi:hypothetical protein
MSGAKATVPRMGSEDVVAPGDAALHELLVSMAGRTLDPTRRQTLLDAVLTIPPLAAWPAESLDSLRETYIVSLGRMSREFRQLTRTEER